MLLKRIIGLPGETVAFVNGHVLINGQILDEPYEKSDCDWNAAPVTLGPDQYYYVGDNRSMPAGGPRAWGLRAEPDRGQSACYENGVVAHPAGRAHGGGRLVLDHAFSRPRKNHPPTAGAGGRRSVVQIRRKSARRRGPRGNPRRFFQHECRVEPQAAGAGRATISPGARKSPRPPWARARR